MELEESNVDDQGHLRKETENDTRPTEKKRPFHSFPSRRHLPHQCGLMKSNLSRVYLLLHARTIDIGALGTVGWFAGGSS